MAKIEPFCGIHYNPEIVEDIAKVICPPYDVITPKEQEEFYQKNPYNTIRLILGKDLSSDTENENKYTRSAGYVEDWLRRNVLVQDKDAGIYFYEQVFFMEGEKKERWGFIALMRLDEEGQQKSVYPHEHTHTAPKEDRLKLIKNVEANLSPIFTIFSDTEETVGVLFKGFLKKTKPLFDVVDSGRVVNRLWKVNDAAIIDKIKSFFAEKEVFIADGHHRYEVAKLFRDYKRATDPAHFKGSYDFIMTFFTPLADDGLCILPTHRLIKNVRFNVEDLETCFNIREVGSREDLVAEMRHKEKDVGVFGLYKEKKFYLLRLNDKRECNRFIQEGPKEYKNLDVVILHKVLFDNFLKLQLAQIFYEVDLKGAVSAVDEGHFDALFLLNPTKMEQIRSIALGGEVMPQKSTYFYPKLTSGFLIHKF
jgi:uncharacterized protein (DUF1015 family)